MIGVFVAWNDKRSDSPGWVIQENGCHIWVGAMMGSGYGHVFWRGKMEGIHRVRYELEVGPIPPGMQIDHFACDNKICCNPAHVRPVFPRENVLRGNTVVALQTAQTHCKNGHLLAGDNLAKYGLRKGRRLCRTCLSEYQRARWHLRRESENAKRLARHHRDKARRAG